MGNCSKTFVNVQHPFHSLPLSSLSLLPSCLCHLLVDLSEVYVFLHRCLGYEPIHLYITTLPNPKGPAVEENVRISQQLLVALCDIMEWNGMNILVWNQDLSSACRSVAGFQLGSKMMTRFAPVMFRPTPPHLQERGRMCVCVCVGGGGGGGGAR